MVSVKVRDTESKGNVKRKGKGKVDCKGKGVGKGTFK
jgi:hypothetical protein